MNQRRQVLTVLLVTSIISVTTRLVAQTTRPDDVCTQAVRAQIDVEFAPSLHALEKRDFESAGRRLHCLGKQIFQNGWPLNRFPPLFFAGKLEKGRVYFVGTCEITQILGPTEAIISFGGSSDRKNVRLTDFRTEDYVDGQNVLLVALAVVDGQYKYVTVMGARRTIWSVRVCSPSVDISEVRKHAHASFNAAVLAGVETILEIDNGVYQVKVRNKFGKPLENIIIDVNPNMEGLEPQRLSIKRLGGRRTIKRNFEWSRAVDKAVPIVVDATLRPCQRCEDKEVTSCGACGGNGKRKCSKCHGRGTVVRRRDGDTGGLFSKPSYSRERCTECSSGMVSCKTCGGRGRFACPVCAGECDSM
jgi:hypothetical protein